MIKFKPQIIVYLLEASTGKRAKVVNRYYLPEDSTLMIIGIEPNYLKLPDPIIEVKLATTSAGRWHLTVKKFGNVWKVYNRNKTIITKFNNLAFKEDILNGKEVNQNDVIMIGKEIEIVFALEYDTKLMLDDLDIILTLLQEKGIEIESAKYSITYQNKLCKLTKQEFIVFNLLAQAYNRHPNSICSIQDIENALHEEEINNTIHNEPSQHSYPPRNKTDLAHIVSSINKKLKLAFGYKIIQNERQSGYFIHLTGN